MRVAIGGVHPVRARWGATVLLTLMVAGGAVGYAFYDPYEPVIDPRYTKQVGRDTLPRFELIQERAVTRRPAKQIIWSQDGSFFVQTGMTRDYTVWSRDGHLISEGRVGAGTGAALSPDGKYLFRSSGAQIGFGKILQVDLAKREIVKTIDVQSPRKGLADAIAVSPDGKRLLAMFLDGTVAVFDTANWQLQEWLKTGRSFDIRTLAVSPDNRHVAGGTLDGKIYVWDYLTGQLVHAFQAQTGYVHSLVYGAAGRLLYSGGDATRVSFDPKTGTRTWLRDADLVRVWRVSEWNKTLGITEGMDGKRAIHALGVSPNGSVIAVGTERRFLRLYEASSGNLYQKLPVDFVVESVRFSPDGRYLAAATDFSVFLWKAVTDQQ